MSIQLDSIYDWTTAPPVIPRRYASDTVIDWDDASDDHAAVGIQWESAECGTTGFTEGNCINPGQAALTETDCPAYGVGEPFTVYGLYTDALGARRPLGEHERLARARFAATEIGGLDTFVANYLDTNETALVIGGSASTWEEAIKLTLGELEAAFVAGGTGVQGQSERTVFMNAAEAVFLGDVLTSQGGVLRTMLGSKVAIVGDGLTKMYVTGSWRGHRGPVLADNAAPDRAINDSSILVQRNYAVGTACGVLGATVPTPA